MLAVICASEITFSHKRHEALSVCHCSRGCRHCHVIAVVDARSFCTFNLLPINLILAPFNTFYRHFLRIEKINIENQQFRRRRYEKHCRINNLKEEM